jgi:hypothetical protein
VAFADIGADHTRGIEAARVIDHNRRLLERTHIVERCRERRIAGRLADDDFDQHHSLNRREEMNADKARRIADRRRERSDRERRGVRGQDGIGAHGGPRHCIGFGLHLPVLEHGLDDEIAILESGVFVGRLDPLEQCVTLDSAGAAAVDLLGDQPLRLPLAPFGRFPVAVDQNDVDARRGRDIGDAGAHEARADDPHALQ